MAQIQPVQIWKDGQVKTATVYKLRSDGDDLESRSSLFYTLLEADTLDVENNVIQPGQIVASGYLSISGQDYSDWAAQPGTTTNQWIYEWAADKLAITII